MLIGNITYNTLLYRPSLLSYSLVLLRMTARRHFTYYHSFFCFQPEGSRVQPGPSTATSDSPTKTKNISKIKFGKFEMDPCFFSPFPDEYGRDHHKLYICEYCLQYMASERILRNHLVSNDFVL